MLLELKINNLPKEIMLYQYGKYINTFNTIKDVCKYCNITNSTFNNYIRGNFKNKNGYTFTYKKKEYQDIVDNFQKEKDKYWQTFYRVKLAEQRLNKIRQTEWYKIKKEQIIEKLLDYCVIKYGRKEKYYAFRLRRWYCLITLRKALMILEDENSNIYSFKDFDLFDEIENNCKSFNIQEYV